MCVHEGLKINNADMLKHRLIGGLIAAMALGVLILVFSAPRSDRKVALTHRRLALIEGAINAYRSEYGSMPDSIDARLGRYFPKEMPFSETSLDAWGNPIIFGRDVFGKQAIVSAGPDGIIGNGNRSDDILRYISNSTGQKKRTDGNERMPTQ